MQHLTIYTDGACSPKFRTGGWAYYVVDHDRHESGYCEDTTSNRMELTAALMALSSLPAPSDVLLVTDSQYVMNGFVKHWVEAWKRRNWYLKDGGEVLNADLWQALDEWVAYHHSVEWQWVRGHTGDPHNELVDTLARREYESRRVPKETKRFKMME